MRIAEQYSGNVLWKNMRRSRKTIFLVSILSSLLIVLSLLVRSQIDVNLARFINSAIAGILLGPLFTFIGGPTQQSFQLFERRLRGFGISNIELKPPYLPQRRYYFAQNEGPELAWRHVLLGGAIFALSGIFGRGVILGINLSGSHGLAGTIVGAVGGFIIGALWGIFLMAGTRWFDHAVLSPHWLGCGATAIGTGTWIVWAIVFSAAGQSPVLALSAIGRLVSVAIVSKHSLEHQEVWALKVVIWCVMLLPITSFLAN